MNAAEINKLEKYLAKTFGTSGFTIMQRPKAKDSVEVNLNGEFIGIIYRDEDEGEVSYPFHMTILDEDLG